MFFFQKILFSLPLKSNHGHLGSNQMLKNFELFNQKMEMLRKNKSSNSKNENVLYPQGQLVTWLAIFPVNDSY